MMKSHIMVIKTIEEGYWTFSMLKKEIESYGNMTLEANKHDGKLID